MNKISPLAFVHPEARIGDGNEIGAFCFIDKNVEIGDNNILMNSVSLLYGARVGARNKFFPGAVISAEPQDLKFKGEETVAIIGDDNLIRENVTVNRGTAAQNRTLVGNKNLLMEGVHIAHDVVVGDDCIIGNATKIAGEVVIDSHAIISASVLVHQFCRIGGYVMVSGGSRTGQDIPPYCIAAREPIQYCGLNNIGLRRRRFSSETIENIHQAYRLIYESGLLRKEALQQIEETVPKSKEIDYILDFFKTSKRGVISWKK